METMYLSLSNKYASIDKITGVKSQQIEIMRYFHNGSVETGGSLLWEVYNFRILLRYDQKIC